VKGRGEDQLAAFLRQNLRRAELGASVELRFDPQRAATGNKSPDFLIHAEIRVPVFDGQVAVIEAPILVELEAGSGFEAGLADLERFVERSTDGSRRQRAVITLPFVVLTEAGLARTRSLERVLPVRLQVSEALAPRGR
jgi:hypothetical protein